MNIVVGDTTSDLADFARSFDPHAVVWSPQGNQSLTAYVSLGDVDIGCFLQILLDSDHIIYHNKSSRWSSPGLKALTDNVIYLLGLNGSYPKISGFPFDTFVLQKNMLSLDAMSDAVKDHHVVRKLCHYSKNNFLGLVNHRSSYAPQIWIAGCSIAAGVGVNDNENYGSIVGRSLGVSTTNIALAGSSVDFAADQILRSHMRSGDLLIWGITGPPRYSWFENGLAQNIIPKYIERLQSSSAHKKFLNLMALDDSRLYLAQRHIDQVHAACHKTQCDLVLIYHEHLGGVDYAQPMKNFLSHYSAFIDINKIVLERFGSHKIDSRDRLDVASDNLHPGVKTHTAWADILIDFIRAKKLAVTDV